MKRLPGAAAFAVACLLCLQSAQSQLLLFDKTDDSFASFGANESIFISGGIRFINGCNGGINDFIFPFSDVYIIPENTLSNGAALVDAGGSTNTIQGGGLGGPFIAEFIGTTGPGGSIPAGRYDIVYDNCQDGIYEVGEDDIFSPAMQVIIGPNIPPLPASIAALKAQADQQAMHWADAAKATAALFAAADAADLISIVLNPTNFVFFATNIAVGQALGVQDPKIGTITTLLNTIKHYAAIANDPPDPNFQQATQLGPRSSLSPLTGDPLEEAGVAAAAEVDDQQALLLALLQSLERYQGAANASNAQWALIHAVAIQDFAGQILDQLPVTSGAMGDLADAVSTDPRDLDQAASILENNRQRVVGSGFNASETATLQSLGFSVQDIADLAGLLAGEDWSGDRGLLSAAVTAIQNNAALAASIASFASDMGPVVTNLQGQTSNPAPNANAGGPYSGTQGIAVNFNGGGSTSPTAITSYTWDLDGDGAFDDATGATPSFAYSTGFSGLVGLKVTNAGGFSDTDYATADIASTNAAPVINSFAPDPRIANLFVGQGQLFEVSATDTDQDPIAYSWKVDGASVGSNPTFDFVPGGGDTGARLVRVEVTDGEATRGLSWAVSVVAAPEPDIAVSPASLSLGNVVIGDMKTGSVFVANEGDAQLDLTPSLGGANDADFSVESVSAASVAPAPSNPVEIVIKCVPSALGARNATLTIASNDPDEPSVQVQLSCNGIAEPQPDIAIDPTSIAFGTVSVGGMSDFVTVTITNVGAGSLEISAPILTGANPGQFMVVEGGGTGSAPILLYENDFTAPNSTPVRNCGFALDSTPINTLWGRPGFQFQQVFTVETVLIDDPIYSDPSGIGGSYAIGMLSSAQNDRLALTFDTQGKQFLKLAMDVSSIDVSGCGGPFGVADPNWLLSLFDSPGGVFNIASPGAPLDTDGVGGTVGPNAFTFKWTKQVATLDAIGSTDGSVTLQWDLLTSGYAAFDNLIIQASDTPALGPDESATVQVKCSPTSSGAKRARLVFQTNDPDEPTVGVDLACEGDAGGPVDQTPPVCELVTIDPGPPAAILLRFHDSESGLAAINPIRLRNATLQIDPFAVGHTDPVEGQATKVDQSMSASVALEVLDVAGNRTVCDPVVQTVEGDLPLAFDLGQNYPNPFNPTTTIPIDVSEPAHVRLVIFDFLGREIAVLVDSQMEAGRYEVSWSAASLPSGPYIYRLDAGPFSSTRMLTLLK